MQKIFVLFLAFAVAASPAFAQPFVPKDGKLLIIGQQLDTMKAYVKAIGIVPAGFMVYTSIQNMDGLDHPADHGAGVHDAKYWTRHYPNAVLQIGVYMVGGLIETLSGRYDGNIEKLARWLKALKCPVYLRIGYEFDLPQNGYNAWEYCRAYRYIVDHLRFMGVKNVAYVWHSACRVEGNGDYMNWYPGDDYVDWFAVSLFSPYQIAVAKNFFDIARQHHKAMMIAESTPAGENSLEAKKEWYKHYFDFINTEGIQAVSYINSNWDAYPLFKSMKWGNARIQDDPQIKELWKKEIANGFLESSPELFNELN